MVQYSSLYQFTPEGLDAFQKVFLGTLDEQAVDPRDPELAVRVAGTKPFAPIPYGSAKAMAADILAAIDKVSLFDLMPNTGLWAWLTFVLRDQLFKANGAGGWKTGEIHRWYPSDPGDYQKGQRHLVRMPVLLLHTLGKNADHLLCGPVNVHGDVREQLTSQQDMFSSSFQAVARSLYFDDSTNGLKRGAGGKAAGSPRRLAKIRQQLDVTWDIDELAHEELLAKLPNEFGKFLSHGSLKPVQVKPAS